jgi:hypothetical protein
MPAKGVLIMRAATTALTIVLAVLLLVGTPGVSLARSTYFAARCASCHDNDSTTCVGCHHHYGPLSAAADATEYAPGATVTVTLHGGTRGGWIRGLLYDENDAEIDRATGPTGKGDDGLPNPITFPVTLQAAAPTSAGTYTWHAAWFGGAENGGGSHLEERVPVSVTVVDDNTGVIDDTSGDTTTWGAVKSLFQ